jgi:hypothetical protein
MQVHDEFIAEGELDVVRFARFAEMYAYGSGPGLKGVIMNNEERVRTLEQVSIARENVKRWQRFMEHRGSTLQGYIEHYHNSGNGEVYYFDNLADLLVAEAEYKYWKSESVRLGYGG